MVHDYIKQIRQEKYFYGIISTIWIATISNAMSEANTIFHILCGFFFLWSHFSSWRDEKDFIKFANKIDGE